MQGIKELRKKTPPINCGFSWISLSTARMPDTAIEKWIYPTSLLEKQAPLLNMVGDTL